MRLRFFAMVFLAMFLALPILSLSTGRVGTGYSNTNPVASFTYLPDVPMPGETITFDASASFDSDGGIVSYTWNFGDGNVVTLSNPTATHSYPTDGNYTVELKVTDDGGASGVSVVVIEVSTVVFFRVVYSGTIIPMANVKVTVYYRNGASWIKAPVGPSELEIKYDNMTQPDLANTAEESYRNPGYAASILRCDSSNIGFDVHPGSWKVFFKFEWGSYVAYWPNDPSRVYSYKGGIVETHDYAPYHQAYYDSSAGSYVIQVSNIPKDGVAPTESHPIIVPLCPPATTKYYLTVRTDPVGITTIPGQGWYNKDTDVVLTAPTYVNVSSSLRYRFSYWDVDGVSKGSGVNPITVRMSANHTATAHYVCQYSVVFSQTGLSSDATGMVVTVDGTAKTYSEVPFTKWVDSGSAVTYSYSTPVASNVTGKRYRLSSVTGLASPITVTSPKNVTGNYVIQYQVNFAQTGLDSTATSSVVTVNSVAKTYADLPYSTWFDLCSSVTYSFNQIVTSSTDGKRFYLIAVHCPPSPFMVTGPITITGEYCKQYRVTFAQTCLDSTATGTVVTVNGAVKLYTDLPFSLWINSGSTVTYSYASTVSSSVSGKRFRLSTVTGPASPITVTGPTTVTGNYVSQYLLTFTQSGLDSTATGTVVTADGSAKAYSQLPYTVWVDSGSSVTYSYTSPVPSSVSGKRFRLSSVSGPSSPITVSGCITVTGNYVVQYSVAFGHSGLDPSATGTVVTVNGSGKTYADLPFTTWVDTGSSVAYSYSSQVSSTAEGKRFRFDTASGPPSPIIVTVATTVTGNYATQYSVTFAQTGLDSTATGTVVTVSGDAKTYGEMPATNWIDSGASLTYVYNDVVLSTTTGKRFKQVSITGPTSPITVTASTTVTCSYKTQYEVTLDQSGVGSDFAGTVVTVDSTGFGVAGLPVSFWWDSGSSHSFAYASPLTVNISKQYAWQSTSGLSTLQSGVLTISGSGSVTGSYIVSNRLTFDQVGVSSDFTGTVLVVDGTPYGVGSLPVSFTWSIGSSHSFAFQTPLVVGANSKQYVWTSTTGLSNLRNGSITVSAFGSIIGNYKTQYYLDLATSPPGLTTPSGSGWYDDGTYASISNEQYLPGGSRYRFNGWTTADMSEITDPTSTSTTVLVDQAKTVTADYVHQYLVTFKQSGLGSDATGTLVTVNGTAKAYGDLPYSLWVDVGGVINYQYASIASAGSGKQYRLTGVSGPASPVTVNADTNVTGNYQAQYCLIVSSPYGTTGGQGWYDSGASAYASVNASTINHGNATRHVFTNWNGDASGTNYAQSNAIVMNGPKTAVTMWKTRYQLTFAQSGLDSSATGTVVTVDGTPKTYGDLPYSPWFDSGTSVTYSYGNVSSSAGGKRFILTGVSGLPSPMTVSLPSLTTGIYKTQYQVTFDQSGVGSDFAGTVVTVDSTGFGVAGLPVSFWWDSGSSHSFAYASPLVVNQGKQYDWMSTTGLSTLQNGTLAVTGSGIVTGNYNTHIKYQVTFSQSGASSDFTGTVVVIDGSNYGVTDLPVSFWWDSGSLHTFSFLSPLNVDTSKRYIWTSTTGLSTAQDDTITITGSGSVTGNYKTQYYLAMATNPLGIDSPTGTGWYDSGTNATISTAAFEDVVPGSSRYRFNGWTTADMAEIADPMMSPTTVLMDKGKTVTANYATQYQITFHVAGVGSDYTDPVLKVDGMNYTLSQTPTSFWWDKDSTHEFWFYSPNPTIQGKRYLWTSTVGLSTAQSGSIAITTSGSITGNYKTQYYLTIKSDYGSPTPPSDWYDVGSVITSTVASPWQGGSGTRYVCIGWTGTGSAPGSGTGTSVSFTLNAATNVTWNWKTQYLLTVQTDPSGLSPQPTRNPAGESNGLSGWWYDSSTSVSLTAQSVSGSVFSKWDVDGIDRPAGANPITVTMSTLHTATAHYDYEQPPLDVDISPTTASIAPNQSVHFTSTESGGTTPYSYQWYLDGKPVEGATSASWTFTPTVSGTYMVYLNVTDSNGNWEQSGVATVWVQVTGAGGYTIPTTPRDMRMPLLFYATFLAAFATAISLIRRKKK